MNTHSPKATRSEIIAYYDKVWSGPGRGIGLDRKQREMFIVSEIVDLKLDTPKILDFGCGMGWLSKSLSTFGLVTGIDQSHKGIEYAKSECPEVEFIVGDVFEYKFPANLFDIIVSQEVIEHVDEQQLYINLAWKYLKPGGTLILTTPNKPAALNRGYTMEQMREKGWLQPIENWLTIEDLRTLCQNRFQLQKICTFYFPTGWRRKCSNKLFLPRLANWMKKFKMSHLLYQTRKAVVGRNLLGPNGLSIGMVATKSNRRQLI